jgi:hypothetical protein
MKGGFPKLGLIENCLADRSTLVYFSKYKTFDLLFYVFTKTPRLGLK